MLKTFSQFKQYAADDGRLRVLDDQDIRDVQQALLEMLDDFHAFCRRNGLCYYITGGTLLGAVRNGGFIPWDDDIDIIMPRADYDRLCACVEQDMGDRYWVQNLSTSDVCDLSYSKLRKKGTKFVEIFENEPERAGLFLDIFPLDDTYDSPVRRFFNGVLDQALFLAASCVRIYNKKDRLMSFYTGTPVERSIRVKAAIGSLLADRKDPTVWFRRCERWQSKYRAPGSKYGAVSSGRGHYFGEIYRKDQLFPVTPIQFEGKMFDGPKNPDHLLSVLFGKDYMTPVDPEMREKHSLIELDLGREKDGE